jgi:DNA-dependent protein kinase catalytic subunit
LRNALFHIALTPECFFTLRNNFAKSLAAMNIANWLLGIGDRHTQNLLINNKNGRLVGIDFNLCFGAATRDLYIPELIPFRLTPQFVNVMDPLGVSGAIKKCMFHALRCFRASKDLLMACMEVFVKDPAVDWQDVVKNRYRSQDEAGEEERFGVDWNPAMRIRLAKEKLEGANPKKITINELAVGVVAKFPNYLKGYVRVVEGSAQHNCRARMADGGLTVENQVECLIDLATDPVVLGVTYAGWCPWL